MEDLRKLWNLQDVKWKNRQSERHIHNQRQRLGRHVKRETQRHMGLYDWQAESSRQSGSSEKARRNISLEFRFDLELNERGRLCLGACFGPKEIKVALDRDAASERNIKRLEAIIGRLHASANLTLLNPLTV